MTRNNKFETPAQKVKREHEEWQNDTTTKNKYRFIVYLLIIGFWYFLYFIYTSGKFKSPNLEDIKNIHIFFYHSHIFINSLGFIALLLVSFGMYFDLEKEMFKINLDKYADNCLKLAKFFMVLMVILGFLDILIKFIYIRSH